MKTAPKLSKVKAVDPVAAPAAKSEPTVQLSVNAQQFNIIMAGLGELPHKHVGTLINDLVAQVQPQVNAAAPPLEVANEE